MPTFTFNCENADDEPGCDGEEEVEVSVSGGDPGDYWNPPCGPDIEYTLPEKCSTCGHVFTQAHLDYMAKEIDENAEQRAVEGYESAREDAAEDEYDRRRDEGTLPRNYGNFNKDYE